jgi:hypothetical protein
MLMLGVVFFTDLAQYCIFGLWNANAWNRVCLWFGVALTDVLMIL